MTSTDTNTERKITISDFRTNYWPKIVEVQFVVQPKIIRDAVCKELGVLVPETPDKSEGILAKQQLRLILDRNLRAETAYLLNAGMRGDWPQYEESPETE